MQHVAPQQAGKAVQIDLATRAAIPCCHPLLPPARALAPYLERIDAQRWYSNYGPLAREFDSRLAAHFDVTDRQVVTVASGTLGLFVALQALGCRAGRCVMPSCTFVATPHAARMAGLTPHFADVDPVTWALDPDLVRAMVARLDERPAAVIPVSPFGAPVDIEAWDRFRDETGIPVVVDAAAAFDSARVGRLPTVISLHATKAFGVGEGGLVLSRDAGLVEEIQKRSNFGYYQSRVAQVAATNAKLSEYHCAAGLAALDTWPQRRAALADAACRYVDALPAPAFRFLPGFGRQWISGTCSVAIEAADLEGLQEHLGQSGIETRRWWGPGCHAEPAFADDPRETLPATERVIASVLCLPFYPDIRGQDIDLVTAAILRS